MQAQRQPTSKRPDIRTFLQDHVLVLDGAMGTQLHERGLSFQDCFDAANLSRPELVLEIHRAFIEAGAQGIQTNTFGANRFRLAGHRRDDQLPLILEKALEIATEAAGDEVYVLASLGPLGVELEPIGRLDRKEARDAFQQVARVLEPGVDGFSLETFGRLDEVLEAVRAIREISDKPIFAHMSVDSRGLTGYGTQVETLGPRLAQAGADVIGLNCSTGPRAILESILRMVEYTDRPLSARPNAGMPREVDGRVFYENNPDYFARFARRFLQAGGRVLGGCCGTTPDHIRAMARSAKAIGIQVRRQPLQVSQPLQGSERPRKPCPLSDRSKLGQALATGQTATSIELLPPRTPNMQALCEEAKKVHDAGATVVNLPDGPRASARVSNLATAVILEREVGVETLLHFCCRDRNLLGMQSDLMGAAALELNNILVVTGDPPYLGNYPDVTAVFDVDSIGLCNILDNLNHGLDLGGNAIDQQTHFCLGAALNPTALDLDREIARYRWKVDAGIDFSITQPIFDVPSFLEMLDRLPEDGPPILAGIWPLRSLRNAEFLAAEVPGVSVPEALLDRMREAGRRGREAAAEEGVAIALEAVEALATRVEGFQIAAPFNKAEPAIRVLKLVQSIGGPQP
ncbi:MAG: bifunctional homocysteine S-methyltransferase/methylenetetrahydrofolate reductase [Planctomycetota bacterium]|nr:MAG: bifunctional homocysteine S-methyltransferase/methylenetetrahydrofolate reductase [Planctomycetota bacterium]